jgi:predicted ATPase
LIETLEDHLRFKKILLVLDNCGHLVERCALPVGGLLRICPALRVLATSRESLGVVGEVSWPVQL